MNIHGLQGGIAGLVLGLCLPAVPFGDVSRSENPANGLLGWHFSEGDIDIELIQRLPDQTR